jgi:tryptophanyl-tRNA synthetase
MTDKGIPSLEDKCRQDLLVVETMLTVNHEATKMLEEELEYLRWVSECAAQALDNAEDALAEHRRRIKRFQDQRLRLVIAMKQKGWTV